MKKGFCFCLCSCLFFLFFISCAPIYKCGDPIPAKKSAFWGKRLKTVIQERDVLCEDLTKRDTTIAYLKNEIDSLSLMLKSCDSLSAVLGDANLVLQKNYDDLQNAKLSEAEKFNNALALKTEELNQKTADLELRDAQLLAKEKELAEREKSLAELKRKLAEKDAAVKSLNDAIKKALLGFDSDELSVEMRDGKVYVSMSNKLMFASGSCEVEPKGYEALKVLSDVMKKNPEIDILIEGHTDNVPMKQGKGSSIKDNWDLSVMRATSIVRILTWKFGVSPTQVTAAGRGEHFPIADNATAEGKAKNRRTEIILTPNLDKILNLSK
ncbi:MAG: OmpA family protein [Paludibacteraceae bacterium]|nr:OmpA family protein [Paludibacteraceae bacterium]